MNSEYFNERYKYHYEELKDEPVEAREVHAIRLAMEDERVHLGLSKSEWTKKISKDAKSILETYGLATAR